MKDQFSKIGDGLLVRAPAKINLSLLIAGKRSDGFHEIETVMAKIDLYDEILFTPGDRDGIELLCKGRYEVPRGRDNLVYKACEELCSTVGARPRIKVTVTKNIPVGSGLGGGSSDAAAALIGLNSYRKFGASENDIMDIACRIGSDVAFFLGGPIAFCKGRGEIIEKISEKFPFSAILILPDVNVSTKRVYANYSHDQAIYNRLSDKIIGFLSKNAIDSLTKMCANMLECSCFGLHRELVDLKSRVETLGIGRVCLSGSGSAMYCMVTGTSDEERKRYQLRIKEELGCESVIVNGNRW